MVPLLCLVGFVLGSASSVVAQAPGDGSAARARAFALKGATIHIAPGRVLEKGTLILRGGLVEACGTDIAIPADAKVFDLEGHIIYPGFVNAAAFTVLDDTKPPEPTTGRPIDASRSALAATPIDQRKGLTPEFEAHTLLKKEAAMWEGWRKAGFAIVHAVPTGRIASGWSTIATTSGFPWRESVVQRTAFPEFQLLPLNREKGYPATIMGSIAHLRQTLLDAKRYQKHRELYSRSDTPALPRPADDTTWENLLRALQPDQRSLFLADQRDDIDRALDFADEFGFRVCLVGGKEATRNAARLASKQVPLVLTIDSSDEPKVDAPKTPATPKPAEPKSATAPTGATGDAPRTVRPDLPIDIKDPTRVQADRRDRWRAEKQAPRVLTEQGLTVALGSGSLTDPALFLKGIRQAVQQGVPAELVLRALTTQAAHVLGQKRSGTLEPGQIAHVVVFNGPFENDKAVVRHLFVDGQPFEYNTTSTPIVTVASNNSTGSPAGSKSAAPPLPALGGTWNVEITGSEGTAKLELSQTGDALSGLFKSAVAEGKVLRGKVTRTDLEFTVGIGAGAQTLELKFQSALDNERPHALKGTLKTPFAAATAWTANRVEPAPLPPPNATGSGPRIELSIDDGSDGAKPPAGKNVPPKATSEPSSNSVVGSGELPTELLADRTKRPAKTGGNLLIRNATVITVTGPVLVRHSILIQSGKIAKIAPDLAAESGMPVLDADGLFVMPGLIDTHSHIMFRERLRGVNEATLSIVPEVRVREALQSEDVAEYRALAGGLTTARLLHGSANVIGGQDAVVKMKFGEPIAQQLLTGNPLGVKFALGENVKAQTDRFPNTRLGVEATLVRAFTEALEYRKKWLDHQQRLRHLPIAEAEKLLPPRRDLRLEALADIINHDKLVHSHCYRSDEILMLLRVAENFGIRVQSLQHVLEGYKVAPEIAKHGASCSTFSDWWAYKMEAYDATPYNSTLLFDAGVNLVLKSDNAELMRHMNREASKLLRYGVTEDQALRSVTINPARELGIDQRVGSIEVGKDADLAIFNRHPFDAFTRCEYTVIDGEIYFSRQLAPTAVLPVTTVAAKPETTAAEPGGAAAPSKPERRPFAIPAGKDRGRSSTPLALEPLRANRYALVGATVHPVEGPALERGVLVVEEGKIRAIGPQGTAIPDGVATVDLTGLHVYPGLIDAGTTLGLVEVGKVLETQDIRETGLFQPDLRAAVAINPDSELIPVARAGGVTTALIRPSGGTVAGQASLSQPDGWSAPEMTVKLEAGLQINWPTGTDRAKTIRALGEFLDEAKTYLAQKQRAEREREPGPTLDPRWEALAKYVQGKERVFIEAQSRTAMLEAINFAEKYGLRLVLTGGLDAWKIASVLREREIPVIVGPIMREPLDDHDPYDAPYANPGRLHAAGVTVCIRSDSASNSRNVPFEAATAVAFGLPEDEGLKAVTLTAAKILGIADTHGSLAAGKVAHLLITDGSPLQPTTTYRAIIVNGHAYSPASKHTRLYDKYRERLRK